MSAEDRSGNFIREKWPLLIALWVAISSNVTIFAVLWPKAAGVDFAVFWRAVHALHPYAANEQPFVYPPTALLWFLPLRLVDAWPGYLIWTAVSVVLFCAAAIWLYGRGATALAIISPAAGVAVIPGQTSLIASAVLFAAFASECRICRGILLAALLALKPQLAVMAPLFLIVRREWLGLAALALAAALLALAATTVFGSVLWSEWAGAISGFQQVVAHRGLSMSAVSPAAFAATVGLPRLPLLLLGFGVALAIALKSRELDEPNTAAMLACASLFAAPYALRYDMIAIAPAMAALILSGSGRKALLACVAYSASFGPLSLAAGTCVIKWNPPMTKPVKES
ncbi:MAG: glycosyltransferase family 87 protein [Sphingomicrobium sp.]